MRLDRIALVLRRRSPWEALDLGRTLLRAWAAPAYRAWFATYWVFGLALLLILWPWQGLAFTLLWWLKPLFDRVLLFVFSRCLFGGSATLSDLRRNLPGLLKGPGLLSALTLRRLSMSRAFLLPVWQLEQQRGEAARARFKLLGRRTRGAAAWLIFVCANMVPVLAFSLIFVTDMFLPGEYSPILKDLFSGDKSTGQMFAINLFVMVAETIVEPFYVASGFTLYLNRRSELEGWDIELAFRRLGERVAEGRSARAAVAGTAAACLAALALVLAAPSPVLAANTDPPAAGHPRQVIEQVLADPVFGKEESRLEWQAIAENEKDKPPEPAGWVKSFLQAVEFFSQVMRGLVWIAALLLLAVLLYLVMRYSEGLRIRRSPATPPDFLFGLDVRPGSLPADVVAAARAALAAGNVEAALSLLYRGALVALIHRLRVEFRAGDTEGECLARVRDKLAAAPCAYFAELLDAWRAAAYAHLRPSARQTEELCDKWQCHFGAEGTP